MPKIPVNSNLPPYYRMLWPMLHALKELGDSGSIQEINDKVIQAMGFSDQQLQILHGGGPQTEIGYRLHWARSYLKAVGAALNTSRGVWAITDAGKTLTESDVAAIPARVRALSRRSAPDQATADEVMAGGSAKLDTVPQPSVFTSTTPDTWRDFLLETLLSIPPASFEKLCQRVLRESGFTKVDVTGRSGDGGIDGIGVLRVSLLSFQVFFQCKRYRGSVGAPAIRDFRGAMVGRTDKGLFITTGDFTPDAKKEATRDGAPVLDLIDGTAFCALLKNLQLGVSTKPVEEVTVDPNWFAGL